MLCPREEVHSTVAEVLSFRDKGGAVSGAKKAAREDLSKSIVKLRTSGIHTTRKE